MAENDTTRDTPGSGNGSGSAATASTALATTAKPKAAPKPKAKAKAAAKSKPKAKAKPKAGAAKPAPAKQYRASLLPRTKLPDEFIAAVQQLEGALDVPVWMLVQARPNASLEHSVFHRFLTARDQICADGHVALVIDSPGGLGDAAYQIARIFQREGGFTVIIPRYAKSAATLLSLGAVRAIMGDDSEIGPLDAQLWDEEREEAGSALNEVAALDRLHGVALEHLDETMITMMGGTRKKTDVLLPIATKFVSDMMRPMLEKIDAVHYAKQSRILAVAEEYAVRLLEHAGRDHRTARMVADVLVNRYPEHGFVIDRDEVELKELLPLVDPAEEVKKAVAQVELALWRNQVEAYGKLEEA